MTADRRYVFGERRVVALHGFTGTPEDWAPLAPLLGANLLALALPGHAGAPAPPPGPDGFGAAVAGLAAAARSAGFGPCDWLGYSMGGRLALAVAAAHPDLVRSLVLIGASAGIPDPAERAARRDADERWARLLEEEGLAAFLERWDAQPLFAGRPTRSPPPPHDPRALAAALRALGPGAQAPLDGALAGLACPVLLLAGERDRKFTAIAEALAELLPRAAKGLVPGAGHAAHVEAPRAVADRVSRFWRTAMLPAWKKVREFEDIRYEVAEGIAKVTIARPEVRNAFRPLTVAELEAAFALARDDREVGVVILTGEGKEAFCSGGDQRVRGAGGYVGADGVPRLNVLDLQRRIRTLPKPVIAMVAGYAIGGGHVLHVVCDLTIAADNARFGQTGPRVGSFDGGYGASYLARLVGQKKAREIWFLCRQYDAREALAMGLVNAVVPLERLEEETVRWCREILALSPMALRCLKSAFNAELDGQAGLVDLAGNATLLYYLSEEAREGKEAFLEKRAPDFGRFPRRP